MKWLLRALWQKATAGSRPARQAGPDRPALLLERLETRTLLSGAVLSTPARPAPVLMDGYSIKQPPDATVQLVRDGTLVARSSSSGQWDAAGPAATADRPLVVWGDLTGDGRRDLVVSSGGHLSVLLAQADGTFDPVDSGLSSEPVLFLAEGDFTRHAHADLLTVTRAGDGTGLVVHVLAGDGRGSFQAEPTLTFAAGALPRSLGKVGGALSVTVGDLLGDGRLELLAAERGAAGMGMVVSVMVPDGKGLFQAPLTLQIANALVPISASDASATFTALTGDFTGHGGLDLMTVGHATGDSGLAITVLSGRGGTEQTVVSLPSSTSTRSVEYRSEADPTPPDPVVQTVPVRIEVQPALAAPPPAPPRAAPTEAGKPPVKTRPVVSARQPAEVQHTHAPGTALVPPPPAVAAPAAVPSSDSAALDEVATVPGPRSVPLVVFTLPLELPGGAVSKSASPAATSLVVRVEFHHEAATTSPGRSFTTTVVTQDSHDSSKVLSSATDAQPVEPGSLPPGTFLAADGGAFPSGGAPGALVADLGSQPSPTFHVAQGRLMGGPEGERGLAAPAPRGAASLPAPGDTLAVEVFGREARHTLPGGAALLAMGDEPAAHLLATESGRGAPPGEAAVPPRGTWNADHFTALVERARLTAGVADADLLAVVATTSLPPASVLPAPGPNLADQAGTFPPWLGTAAYLGSLSTGRPAAAERADCAPSADSRMLLAEMMQRFTETFTRLVQQLYRHFLGRAAVLGEEQGWVQMLLHGHGEESVLAALLGTPEFVDAVAAHGGSGSLDERYLRGLHLLLLGRPGTQDEVHAWVAALPTLGREGVVTFLAGSQEYRARQVEELFRTAWRREGTPAEVAAWASSPLELSTLRLTFEAQGGVEALAGGTGMEQKG
jgi:hypothetical protein